MARQFDLLVFDWDGTLMDSAACIAGALQAACRDLAFPVPSERDARYIIGLGLNDALAHILPGLAPTEDPRVVERYRHHFLLGDQETGLFEGAADMLAELHRAGHLLAVATGKSRRGLERALQATAIGPYFHATRCADEGFSKPHPGMLQWLIAELKTTPERTLMIGDTTHDMQMARAAGVARLAVAHGAHEACDLLTYEPLACVADCAALRKWLRAHA